MCPICKQRISNWWKASGKTQKVNGVDCHKACLIDYKLRHGKEYEGEKT